MHNRGDFEKTILVTGGAGFIGINLVEYLTGKYPRYLIVNLDCLTYAANEKSLAKVNTRPNHRFEKIDITDKDAVTGCFDRYRPDGVIHLAAETHVDRSIKNPAEFIETNIKGTFNLLECARDLFDNGHAIRFHHISTDEVFGSETTGAKFTEGSKYYPNSPYAASKASADHLVRAYNQTFGMDNITTNCGNNFGPYQFPEKLIPLTILNALEKRPVPVYGDGRQIRDWIYVIDHCRGIDTVFHGGKTGETYNVGARNEIANIDLVNMICDILDKRLGGSHGDLIEHTGDRPGHDRRYAIDPSKLEKELGWKPEYVFAEALEATIDWYLANKDWLYSCINDDYREYRREQYAPDSDIK